MDLLQRISDSLRKGDAPTVAQLTKQAVSESLSPGDVMQKGLVAGMAVVGEDFKNHRIFLPDVLLAARAMYAGMDILKPLMIRDNLPSAGKVVIGTVQGDLHDIGKNLVAIMLKGAGFDVIDLGNDVSPERFLDTAEAEGARVVGMSALLTTTMPAMKKVIELARQRGMYGRVRFLVGGAPLSAAYASEIGADAYCFDGVSAVERTRQFLGGN